MTRLQRRRNPGGEYIIQLAVPSADGYLRSPPFDYGLSLDDAAKTLLDPPVFVRKKFVKGTFLLVSRGESAPPDIVAAPKGRKGLVLATDTGFSSWEPGAGGHRVINGKEIGLTTVAKAGTKSSQWRMRREYNGWGDYWYEAWERWAPEALVSLIYSCSPGPANARAILLDIAERCIPFLDPANTELFTQEDLDFMRRFNGSFSSATKDDIERLQLKKTGLLQASDPKNDWLQKDVLARKVFAHLIASIFKPTVGYSLWHGTEEATSLLGSEPVRQIIHSQMTFAGFIWGALTAQRMRLLLKREK